MSIWDSTRITHRGPGIKLWRLIIRNLDFNTKEEDVQHWANKFGKILEIQLPKCKDKRFPNSCAGFCFIQFAKRKEAEKAMEELNFTELKSRKVAVDWALDKDRWVTMEQEAKNKVKVEPKKECYNDELDEEGEEALNKNNKVKIEPKEEYYDDDEHKEEEGALKKTGAGQEKIQAQRRRKFTSESSTGNDRIQRKKRRRMKKNGGGGSSEKSI